MVNLKNMIYSMLLHSYHMKLIIDHSYSYGI